MKKVVLILLSFMLAGTYVSAQETTIKKEKKRIRQEQKQMKDLNLNDNQGQQVKDINSAYKTAHKDIMKNDALSQEQKREQIQALNKRRVDDIHNIIGQDKIKEWKDIKQNSKQNNKPEKEKANGKPEKEKQKNKPEKKKGKG